MSFYGRHSVPSPFTSMIPLDIPCAVACVGDDANPTLAAREGDVQSSEAAGSNPHNA